MESLQQPSADDVITFEARLLSDMMMLPPYNAYSAAGSAEGSIVYVNYGRETDFARLKEMGVIVQEKIVIARNGEIYRGNKVANAEAAGAKGVILYSDPEDTAKQGQTAHAVYPNTWWLPGE
jgi:hypothetical protein